MELGVKCVVHNDVSVAWKKVICIIDMDIVVGSLMSMPADVAAGMLAVEVMDMLIELMSIVRVGCSKLFGVDMQNATSAIFEFTI